MVDKQELHDTASSESGWFGVCVNFHGGGDLRAAAGNGFRWFFDFYKAHSAVTGNFESFMVAESGYFDTILFGRLVNGEIIIDLVGFAVDEDFDFFGREGGEWGKDVLDEFKFWKHGNLLLFLSLLQINY